MQNNSKYEPFSTKFSLVEGLTSKHTDYTTLNATIKSAQDLSGKIQDLYKEMDNAIDNDILDDDGNLNTKGRLVDVARQDVQTLLIQQNTLYMLGTITIATLLITAILISK